MQDSADSDPETDSETNTVRELVFHTPQYTAEHKVLGFDTGITKIKITRAAQKKAKNQNEIDLLDIIIWLFTHTNAEALDLSECYVGEHTVAKIAALVHLQVLDLSNCKLRPGSLVPIGESSTLQETLRELYVHDNSFSLKDTRALALLTTLEVLNLSDCKLHSGSLVPIGNSKTLQETLRELYAYNNRFCLEDTKALALLTSLEILDLSNCKLRPGSLVPIGESSALQETLHELYARDNKFCLEDTKALSLLTALEILDLPDCKLRSGSLVPIGNSKTLQETLRKLRVHDNRFCLEDTKALALLTALEELDLSNCKLRSGSLVPIGESEALQKTLRELYAHYNRFGLEDTTALSLLATLELLRLRNCELPLGSLAPINESTKLQETLRKLDLAGNRDLGLEDEKVIE